MRFMVMVKTGENQGPPPKELMEAMAKRAEESGRAGALLQTGGLAPSLMGARVRVSGGKLTVTDGPFTEAKEVVGGYAVVEARSKEEAIEGARWLMQLHIDYWPGWEGEAEVRHLVNSEDFGGHTGGSNVR